MGVKYDTVLSKLHPGCMKVSEEGIIKRDEIVFKNAIGKKIPILMVLGGGCMKKSALVTAMSIGNLLENVIGFSKVKYIDSGS